VWIAASERVRPRLGPLVRGGVGDADPGAASAAGPFRRRRGPGLGPPSAPAPGRRALGPRAGGGGEVRTPAPAPPEGGALARRLLRQPGGRPERDDGPGLRAAERSVRRPDRVRRFGAETIQELQRRARGRGGQLCPRPLAHAPWHLLLHGRAGARDALALGSPGARALAEGRAPARRQRGPLGPGRGRRRSEAALHPGPPPPRPPLRGPERAVPHRL